MIRWIAFLYISMYAFASSAQSSTTTNGENKQDPVAVIPAKDQVPAPLLQLGQGKYFSNYAFLMDKANRTLTVWQQQDDGLKLILAVPADFGKNGGDKTSAGDHRTPEGIYFFQEAKSGPGLDFEQYGIKAFTLDYPNFFDTREKKSGNGIWLHAIPDTKSLLRGSRGCVVVRNEIINQLSPYITLKKTPILIQNSVAYLDRGDAKNGRQTWQSWLQAWRSAWQNKDVNSYMNYYGEKFSSMKMNKAAWQQYKSGLNAKYKYIKVEISEPVIVKHGPTMIVRFLQTYESDVNSDFGEKTLYLSEENGTYKIIGEEWAAAQKDNVVANH